MAEYNYIDKTGVEQATTATTPESAIANAPNIAPTSGVATSPAPITPSSLTSTATPVTVPTPDPATAAGALLGQTEALAKQGRTALDQEAEQRRKAAEDAAAGSKTGMDQALKDLLGVSDKQTELENTAGIPKLSQDLADIQNQIEAKQLSSRREIERLQTNGQLSKEQASAFIQEADRKSASEQADLAIIQSARSRNLAVASDLVNRKVALMTEQAKIKLDYAQKFYDENKQNLTKAEDRQWNMKLDKEKAALEKQTKAAELLENTRLQAITAAAQQDAPASVLQAIQAAKTPEEAIKAAGVYGGDMLGNKIKKAQLAKINQEINQANVGGNLSNVDVNNVSSKLPSSEKNTGVISSIIKNSKISQGSKTNLANILGVIESATGMAKGSSDGKFTGLNPFRSVMDVQIPFTDIGIPFRNTAKRSATIENEEYINGINLRTQVWASGAALTKQQTEQVEKMTPTVKDTDRIVQTKLNALSNFMMGQAKSVFQSEGIDFKPQTIDLFEPVDAQGVESEYLDNIDASFNDPYGNYITQ